MFTKLYSGDKLREVSFPVGGIGAGCVGLAGNGEFVDWEIKGHPDKGTVNEYTHFAVKAENENGVFVKVLQGDHEREMSGHSMGMVHRHRGYGYGPDSGTMAGFPHFKKNTFEAAFPWAKIEFEDEDFPAKPVLNAFSPFVPRDSFVSSIPCAFYYIDIKNDTEFKTDYTIAFTLGSLFENCARRKISKNGMTGIEMTEGENSVCALTDAANAHVTMYWYRGGWVDAPIEYWDSFSKKGFLPEREYEKNGNEPATMEARVTLEPGDTTRVKFILAWRFPTMVDDWDIDGDDRTWTHYYATKFASAYEAGKYAIDNYDDIKSRVCAFRDAFYSQTIPPEFIDAAGSSLSTLVTPVCLRLEDGSFYGWEGASEKGGSCEGSCQHVWNYAYALPYLYPDLEMSVMRLEKNYSQWDDGHITFRVRTPLGRGKGWFMPCVDGQMGYVMKIYREWKNSGDDEWLKEMYPSAKKAIEFAWLDTFVKWDADKDGIITGRQHHTLDMELFGASSWLEGFYLGALKAMTEMGAYLNDDISDYERLYNNGREYLNSELFNGRYFYQKVDLKDIAQLDRYENADVYKNEVTGELKYQIGDGVIIDQALAQWHSDLMGLGEIFDESKLQTALESMYEQNFITHMRDFFNPCRIFSANDESGLVICGYPEGAYKPLFPVPYCQETMTGFEYAAAGLYLRHGMQDKALNIVKAVRDRYDGNKRNPFNELECGSNYARVMAAFALIPLSSGWRFDAVNREIFVNPVNAKTKTMCFFDTGWGMCETDDDSIEISLNSPVTVKAMDLPFEPKEVYIDGVKAEFEIKASKLIFNAVQCAKVSIKAL